MDFTGDSVHFNKKGLLHSYLVGVAKGKEEAESEGEKQVMC